MPIARGKPARSTRLAICATASRSRSRCSAPSIPSAKRNFSGSHGPFKRSSNSGTRTSSPFMPARARRTSPADRDGVRQGESLTDVIERSARPTCSTGVTRSRSPCKLPAGSRRPPKPDHPPQYHAREHLDPPVRQSRQAQRPDPGQSHPGPVEPADQAPGEIVGDIRYTPPERTVDESIADARSDIYSRAR